MNNFIYDTPTKVYFGKDEELKIGKIISEYHPSKVLIHFGGASARKSGLLERVENCLKEENISFVELGGVVANPELSLVREGMPLVKGRALILYWQSVAVPYWTHRKPLLMVLLIQM